MSAGFKSALPFLGFSFGGGALVPVSPLSTTPVTNRNLVSQLNIRAEVIRLRPINIDMSRALSAIQDNANTIDDRLRRLSTSLNSVGLTRDLAGNVTIQGSTFNVRLPLQQFTMSGQGQVFGLSPVSPTDDSLPNSSIGMWVNELTDELIFRVRYSDGTLKEGVLALA